MQKTAQKKTPAPELPVPETPPDAPLAPGQELEQEATALEQALGIEVREVDTNKGVLKLEEFDLWGCARAMKLLGRMQARGNAMNFTGGVQNRQLQFSKLLLEGAEEMLELIAISAGICTEDTAVKPDWKGWHRGIKSRYMLPLIMACYEVNQSFFEELISTLFMVQNAEGQLTAVVTKTLEAALQTSLPPPAGSPHLRDGVFSLEDLQAMASPRPPSGAPS